MFGSDYWGLEFSDMVEDWLTWDRTIRDGVLYAYVPKGEEYYHIYYQDDKGKIYCEYKDIDKFKKIIINFKGDASMREKIEFSLI